MRTFATLTLGAALGVWATVGWYRSRGQGIAAPRAPQRPFLVDTGYVCPVHGHTGCPCPMGTRLPHVVP